MRGSGRGHVNDTTALLIIYTIMTTERGQTGAGCLSEQTTKLSERHRVQRQDTLLGAFRSTVRK